MDREPNGTETPDPAPTIPCTLMSAEPDLRVVVKYQVLGVEKQTEYQMYAPILAMQSRFVDTALRVKMMEQETRTIHFQCKSPRLFEKAMLYLTDYEAAKRATVEDAQGVVEFYHMYQFPWGLSFWDDKIADFIANKKYVARVPPTYFSGDPPEPVCQLVNLVVLADKFDLKRSCKEAITCINYIFNPFEYFLANFFTKERLTSLKPFLLNHYDSIFLPFMFKVPRDEVEELVLFTRAELEGSGTGRDGLDDTYYNKGDGRWLQSGFTKKWGATHISKMTVEEMDAWTVNSRTVPFIYIGPSRRPVLTRGTGDWAIFSEYEGVASILWRSPNSSYLPLPPEGPWECVDKHNLVDPNAEPKLIPW